MRNACLTFLLFAAASPAFADTMTFTCPAMDGSAETTLAFEGGDSGTLTVTGAYGPMSLPATKVERDATIDGETYHSVGIRGLGKATVAMPDLARMEACVAGKGGDSSSDPDTLAFWVIGCQSAVAPGEPVAIDAEVEVTVIDAPEAQVFISRTYEASSAALGTRLKLDSFPPLACTMAQ